MKIISICNQKGGVGKTTVTYHLGHGLAEKELKTLLIDLDPQGNLSYALEKENACTASEIFSDKPTIKTEPISDYLDLVSSNVLLAKIESRVDISSYIKLRQALTNTKNKWNFVLIDSPPSLGTLTLNGLLAADSILIVTLPYHFAIIGLKDLLDIIENVREGELNPKISLLGILLNMVSRTTVAKEAITVLERKFGDTIFYSRIPQTIRLEECLQNKQPIWQYERSNPASSAYKEFIMEFLQKVTEAR